MSFSAVTAGRKFLDDLRSTRFDHDVNRTNNTVDVTLYFVGGADKADKAEKRRERPF
jgi:hypothetical protein